MLQADETSREMALRSTFKTYDKDKDGKLSFEEMAGLLKAGNPTFSDRELRAAFDQADKDNDGKISFDEYVEYVCAKTTPIKIQPVEGVPWSTDVGVPRCYRNQGTTIPKTEQRGITLLQIITLADLIQKVLKTVTIMNDFTQTQVTWQTVNMYDIDPHFVRPLTLRFRCSFVELVANGSQLPKWFVSHWWGTEFCQTVALLEFHVQRRELTTSTSYWICTFANNQHDLSELASSLKETPFVKAIMSEECAGTVAVFDAKVTTLRRVWCVLENYVSTVWADEAKSRHLYDIVAWLAEGQGRYGGDLIRAKPTLRMDLGNGLMQECVLDEETGGAFPLTVSTEGVKIDVYESQASQKEDWRNILHLLAETPAGKWAEDPPAKCAAYDKINSKARQMFAAGAMYGAALADNAKQLESLLAAFPGFRDEGVGSDCATPLHGAAFKGSMKALRVLLRAQADPNVVKDGGASPIFIAAQHARDDVLSLLLQARGDPNLARTDGMAPVHIAVQSKSENVLQTLLKAAANPDLESANGGTALIMATQAADLQTVKVLLQGRADPNQQSAAARAGPLTFAKDEEIVQALMDAKADPSKTLARSMSPSPSRSRPAPMAFGAQFGDAMAGLGGAGGMAQGMTTLYDGV